jgi:hypothetical protein
MLEAINLMSAQFAQLYFCDPAEGTAIRVHHNTDLNPLPLCHYLEKLVQVNPSVSQYTATKERLEAEPENEFRPRIALSPQLKLILEKSTNK